MAEVDPRDERIAKLEAQLKAALARIAELEARLGLKSRNSNKPSSSDGPGVKREAKLMALLAGQYRLSKRLVQQLLGDVTEVGQRISAPPQR